MIGSKRKWGKSIEEFKTYWTYLWGNSSSKIFFYEFVQRAIYLGKSQFKTSSISAATVFNAAISLFYSWKFCFLSGCLLNSPQKNTNSHFVNSASAIELCDFFHGNLILQCIDVIVQKRVRVFHRVSKRRDIWNHEATGRVVLLFSSVWKPDETRSRSFWKYFSKKEN